MKIIIASTNKNKIIEIREKFSSLKNIEISSIAEYRDVPEIIEDGKTFKENALKKARFISKFTNLPALADDSGLEIDALNGEPGIYSARYGGDGASDHDRNLLVLDKMKDTPDDRRNARFVCIIAIVMPDGREYTAEGVCPGIITREIKGSHGFGYDPVFFIPHLGKTMAELTLQEKNKISHRALALNSAKEILGKILD